MKGLKTDYKREFVPNRADLGWKVVFSSEIMGIQPVGPRLAKGSLPNLGLAADTEAECLLLCEEWNEWYRQEWRPQSKKRRGSTRI